MDRMEKEPISKTHELYRTVSGMLYNIEILLEHLYSQSENLSDLINTELSKQISKEVATSYSHLMYAKKNLGQIRKLIGS
jgi:hypothetical protein